MARMTQECRPGMSRPGKIVVNKDQSGLLAITVRVKGRAGLEKGTSIVERKVRACLLAVSYNHDQGRPGNGLYITVDCEMLQPSRKIKKALESWIMERLKSLGKIGNSGSGSTVMSGWSRNTMTVLNRGP